MKTQQWQPFKSDLQIIFVVCCCLRLIIIHGGGSGEEVSSSVYWGIKVIWLEMHMFLTRKKRTPRAQTLHWHFILKALHFDGFRMSEASRRHRYTTSYTTETLRVISSSRRSVALHCLKMRITFL